MNVSIYACGNNNNDDDEHDDDNNAEENGQTKTGNITNTTYHKHSPATQPTENRDASEQQPAATAHKCAESSQPAHRTQDKTAARRTTQSGTRRASVVFFDGRRALCVRGCALRISQPLLGASCSDVMLLIRSGGAYSVGWVGVWAP